MAGVCRNVEADLVVVGGGIAGCAAAVAAARLGMATVLIQNRPVLGGNASSEIGLLMAGADRDFPHARETGIIEEIDLTNRFHNYEVQWRNAISDSTLEFLVRDAGVDLYLNTHVHEVVMTSEKRLGSVLASQQSTEKKFCFSAPLFVDASGDGFLAAEAGAGFRIGSESRDEFGESLAPAEASRTTMGSTLMFRTRALPHPVPFVRPEWAYEYPDPEMLPVKIRSLDRPQLWIEYGARLDTIGDNMAIREELLKILYGVWDHIKNHGDYGAENLALAWVGAVPGKRESRRVIGDYTLTQHDLENSTQFSDAVAYGGWPIDVHNPDGFYARKKWLDYTHLRQPYQIPYRCYCARDLDNLFLAGRCISATHVAHGSIRLIRTCAVGGQAVGSAAWLCLKHRVSPRELRINGYIPELQQLLLKYDCYLPGVVNQDPADLARAASVSASSELTDTADGCVHAASKVVSGLSRGTDEDENLWISASFRDDQEPWLCLNWNDAVTIDTLHLTFDTAVREQRFFDRPVLGAIPECVRDFQVEVKEPDGRWRLVAEVRDNFLRHRIVKFSPLVTDSLKIRVKASNGDDHARIYEVRAYCGSELPK